LSLHSRRTAAKGLGQRVGTWRTDASYRSRAARRKRRALPGIAGDARRFGARPGAGGRPVGTSRRRAARRAATASPERAAGRARRRATPASARNFVRAPQGGVRGERRSEQFARSRWHLNPRMPWDELHCTVTCQGEAPRAGSAPCPAMCVAPATLPSKGKRRRVQLPSACGVPKARWKRSTIASQQLPDEACVR
jgi:hypothetical protein